MLSSPVSVLSCNPGDADGIAQASHRREQNAQTSEGIGTPGSQAVDEFVSLTSNNVHTASNLFRIVSR